MQVAEWAWWFGLVLGAVPLLAVALWHGADSYYRARFHGSLKLPPGHMGFPLVGETLSLLWYFKVVRRPDGFIDAKKTRYGEEVCMYRTHLFGSPSVLVCSPAANKFVLQSPDSFGIRWPSPELVGVASVSNAEGAQHARLRGFIVAAINQPSSLRRIAQAVQPRVTAALLSWADRGTITAATEIRTVTFDNICETFVSMKPSPLTAKIRQWFAGVVAGVRATPWDIPGTAFHRALKCRRKLTAVFRTELQTRRKNNNVAKDDLMSGLMRTEDEQGNKLSDDEVVDSIVSLVVGGYESTASAIMWAVYYLAKSPDALAKLREENVGMRREMNGASNFLSFDDTAKMKYTAKVVEEAIRLANIAPTIFRVAHKDVEYRGYTIPKGWKVVVWLRSLHTDARYYPDPLTFNPDRWDKPAKPGTYQVFGGGHRICAGNMLARLQLTIMLHHLALGYQWKLLNPDAAIDYLPHPRPVDGAAMAFRKLGTSSSEDPLK
uniref:Uncharacterized protein n=1 Tax=Avena sativa TaxID=4498 RepID=A0ACD5XBH8_AVESA